MTIIRWALVGASLLAVPVLAAEPKPSDAPAAVKQVDAKDLVDSLNGPSVEGATPEHQAILSKCSAMKFETSVAVGSGADARVTKVKLCSRDGETKEQWIASLSDAAAKIDANLDLAPDSRAKLIAAIQAEITRLKG